ncbi:MAG: polyribonucleotide nucleotidyltransferase [Candidatus Colwellbacteria bacterium]|nr:polyribonucleotide nucleotidyltransferase [Candidatus Colwellbacteria bacterium]
MDLNRKDFSIDIGGRELTLEVSKIGEQANAAVLGTYGGTTVLVTVVMGKTDRDIDYLPLTVDYEEKFYAAGKIIGSRFVRREGKASDEAILSGRLVDRTIRPLFDHRIRRDIQVVVTIVSYDEENDPDLAALISASTALGISNIPWNGPVAGVKVAKIGDRMTINPKISELRAENLNFETFVSGVKGKINMVELGGSDAKESDILSAFEMASGEIDRIIEFEEKIIKEIGKPKDKVTLFEPEPVLRKLVEEFLKDKLASAIYVKDKVERQNNYETLGEALVDYLKEKGYSGKELSQANYVFNNKTDEMVHEKVIESNERPDGRALDEVRDLHAEAGILKRTHGSAIFVRGNTQALVVATIAPPGAEQLVETMEYSGKRRFMLHYNFPPYSVGETGFFRGPSRRDIGHGALAEKAIRPLIPSKDKFPYTIRVVSEILSSNGSSSMATVCGASLALMDAGVPIKKPAAGIAMGLMLNPSTGSGQAGSYKILTDIQGPEDHHGDMDLKVAGTRDGVNAIQMDVKIEGLTLEILEKTLAQAKKARLEILDFTDKVLDKPRPELSPFAPRVLTIDIDPTRIGEVIGPGGKVINAIIARTGATTIDIEESGRVYVAASNPEAAASAIKEIEGIMKSFEVGDIVEGEVVRILEFGAIVDLGGGKDGMIHVSELRDGFVKKVEDVVGINDHVRAKVIKVENGKIGLSLRQVRALSTDN